MNHELTANKVSDTHNQSGFTLVEFMIVIVIISLLVVVGFFYSLGFVRDARDAKRLSDLQFITKLFSLYYSDHGFYPPSNTIGVTSSGCAITPQADSECQALADEMRTYSARLPYDPSDNGLIPQPDCISSPCYFYKTMEPTHASFCVCTNLEGEKYRNKPNFCDSLSFNYCIAALIN